MPTRISTTLAQRIRIARRARGLTQEQLATSSGVKQGDISKLETGRVQKSTAMGRLARALSVSVTWLELDEDDPAPDLDLVSTNGKPALVKRSDTGADSPPPRTGGAVYQGVSQPSLMIPTPLLEWTDLMSGDLPSLFKLTVLDDAMTPEFKPGSVVIFTAGLQPKPRDAVLVRDPLGNHYFREYRVGLVGQWYAAALHNGFDPLYPEQHGIEVVAVMTGRDGRRSD